MSLLFVFSILLSTFLTVESQTIDESTKDSIQTYTIVSWILILLCVFTTLTISIIAFFYHQKINGSDSPNWISFALYSVSTIDFLTDIIFFGELSIQNHQLVSYAAIFLFIPHMISNIVCIAYILRMRYPKVHKPLNIEWMNRYDKWLIITTFFGNFYGTIEIMNCQIFHFECFNMQIVNKNRNQVHLIHIINDILIGSFPCMILQMAYMSLNQYVNISIAIIAMLFSFTSIAIGIFIIVSRLCNNLVDMLIPDDDNADASKPSDGKHAAIYRLMICKSDKFNNHNSTFSHKLIANVWSGALQISEYQIQTIFIEKMSSNNNIIGITCKIKIRPEVNDENLYLLLNLLENQQSGLYDILKQQIMNKLCLNGNNVQLLVQRTDKKSGMQATHNSLNINYGDVVNEEIVNLTWKCNACTFENHYLIEQCEVCQHTKDDNEKINNQDINNDLAFELIVNKAKHKAENKNINKAHDVENGFDNLNEEKQLFKDIESDNIKIPQPKDGGLWTGDLIDNEHDSEIENINNEIDNIENIEHDIEVSIDISNNDNDNNNNNIENNIEESVDISNNDNIIYHRNEQQSENKSENNEESESDMKQDEIDMFDNRITNDGLNDDFDDLRESDRFNDVFGDNENNIVQNEENSNTYNNNINEFEISEIEMVDENENENEN